MELQLIYPDLSIVALAPRPSAAPAFRLRWDDETGPEDWNYKSRTLSPNWQQANPTPAIWRLNPQMRTGDDTRVNVSAWEDWIIALNDGDLKKFNFYKSVGRALFNTAGWPQLSQLGFSGGGLKGEFIGAWFRLETLRVDHIPNDVSFATHPHLIHKWANVGHKAGGETIRNYAGYQGQVVWCPLISREGFAYVPARWVVKA